MAMKCCVCEDVLLHVDEVDELQKSKKDGEPCMVSSGYCPDYFGRLVGSAIGIHAEKAVA